MSFNFLSFIFFRPLFLRFLCSHFSRISCPLFLAFFLLFFLTPFPWYFTSRCSLLPFFPPTYFSYFFVRPVFHSFFLLNSFSQFFSPIYISVFLLFLTSNLILFSSSHFTFLCPVLLFAFFLSIISFPLSFLCRRCLQLRASLLSLRDNRDPYK